MTKNTTSYTNNAADELTALGSTSYTYDANGNLQARGSDAFTFNYANQLTGATVGGVTSTSTYNGDGLRMSHTANTQTANYVWDVNRSVPEILQDGTNTYVYGIGLISSTDGSGVQTYYDADGLGSTSDLTDSSHAKTDGYTYDAFGAPTHSPGTSSNVFQFTGQQTDADSGLQYLRARYYDPGTGRFLSQDPIRRGNLYAYTGNNPVSRIDPSGLCFGLGSCGPVDDLDNVGNQIWEAGDDVVPYVSQGVQLADLLPLWGSIPFVNIPATFISWPLDVAAFGFSLYDVWTSECSFKTKLSLTLNTGVNLGAGIAGQGLADLASPSIIGPAIISVTVSAIETSLYAANALALSQCGAAHLSLQSPISKAPLRGKE